MSIQTEQQLVFVVNRHGVKRRYFIKAAAIHRLAIVMTEEAFSRSGLDATSDWGDGSQPGGWSDSFMAAIKRTERRIKKLEAVA
ncbi:MAG: hypothetical protein V7731_24190 [Amphritea sp.]